jgi:DNA modification methylase
MIIETVPLQSLKLDPNNARKHDKRNLTAIQESLNQFGQRKPIVVTADNTVIAGNGTLEAAQSLGWTEIAVARIPSDWTPDQTKAYALADNRSSELAEWDDSILATQLLDLDDMGWDIEALGFEPLPLRDIDDTEEDEILEPPVEPKTKLGDMWQIGPHRILCGDSLNKENYQKLTQGSKVDAVVTDPPYGISIVGNLGNVGGAKAFGNVGGGKIVAPTAYRPILGDETPDLAANAFNLVIELYPQAKQVWWGANHYAGKAKLPDSSCWLVWDKNNTGNFADAELAWTNNKGAVRLFKHTWNGMIRESEREKRFHPTQKPAALAKWIFETLKIELNQTVLDVFAGSGFTLLAAAQTGKIGLGIELDPSYVDVIVARLEKETGLKAELVPVI